MCLTHIDINGSKSTKKEVLNLNPVKGCYKLFGNYGLNSKSDNLL